MACFGGSQYEALKLLNINFYILRKQPCIQQALDLLSQPWKITSFPKTRSRMLVNFLLGMRSSLWDLRNQDICKINYEIDISKQI